MGDNEHLDIPEVRRMIGIAEREVAGGNLSRGLGILQGMIRQIRRLQVSANQGEREQLEILWARATAALLNRPEGRPQPERVIQQQPGIPPQRGQALDPRDHVVQPDGTVFLSDIVGLAEAKEVLCQAIVLPEAFPGRTPATNRWNGVLLFGGSGCGKTKLVRAFINSYARSMRDPIVFLHVTFDRIMGNFFGDTERNLTAVFNAAQEYESSVVCLIDEIDCFASRRDRPNQPAGDNRIINHLLQLMDGLRPRGNLLIIATTNLVDQIDPAFYRRFLMVYCKLPTLDERSLIFEKIVDRIRRPGRPSIDYHAVAAVTDGYSPSDLWRIVTLAHLRNGSGRLTNRIVSYLEQGRQIDIQGLEEEAGEVPALTTANLLEAKSVVTPTNSFEMINKLDKFYREHGGNNFDWENVRPDSDCGWINWCCINPLKGCQMLLGELNRFFGCD